jgi:hypothetical protein
VPQSCTTEVNYTGTVTGPFVNNSIIHEGATMMNWVLNNSMIIHHDQTLTSQSYQDLTNYATVTHHIHRPILQQASNPLRPDMSQQCARLRSTMPQSPVMGMDPFLNSALILHIFPVKAEFHPFILARDRWPVMTVELCTQSNILWNNNWQIGMQLEFLIQITRFDLILITLLR